MFEGIGRAAQIKNQCKCKSFARIFIALLLALAPGAARAHQPVMDMTPRWEEGFGVQLRREVLHSKRVLTGSQRAPNPQAQARERHIETTWLEGVYTFRREVRVTVKVPWVEQRRVQFAADGGTREESGRGVGDVLLAVPLRKYKNLRASTYNFGVTPQLRLPTGGVGDAFAVGDGSFDAGLGASFTWESPLWYAYFDAFYWRNGAGARGAHGGDERGLDINLGVHPLHDAATESGLFVMLDIEARDESLGRSVGGFVTGARRLTVGPVLVAYRGNAMLRAEWRYPVYESVRGTQFSRGTQWTIGLGAAF